MRLPATGDVRATAAQHASFRRFADIGDPLADDLVAMMQRLPPGEGRRMFEPAVEHGIEASADPPAELVALGQRARVAFINRGLSRHGWRPELPSARPVGGRRLASHILGPTFFMVRRRVTMAA